MHDRFPLDPSYINGDEDNGELLKPDIDYLFDNYACLTLKTDKEPSTYFGEKRGLQPHGYGLLLIDFENGDTEMRHGLFKDGDLF